MYLVFAFYDYYPSGGWNDFRKAFDNELDAKHFAYELVNLNESHETFQHSHVVDVNAGKIIHKF